MIKHWFQNFFSSFPQTILTEEKRLKVFSKDVNKVFLLKLILQNLVIQRCPNFGGYQPLLTNVTLEVFLRGNFQCPSAAKIWKSSRPWFYIPIADNSCRCFLKSWLNKFLSFCMRQLKRPKIWRRALVVAIPKPNKPTTGPKSYRPNFFCVSCLKSRRDLFMPALNQL